MSGRPDPASAWKWPAAALLCLLAGTPAWGADAPAPKLRIEGDVLRDGERVLRLQFDDGIDAARARQLRGWLAEVAAATLTAYGRLPLPEATVRVSETTRPSRSPVPWGQTLRRGDTAVLLYVRRDASLEELRADWTAVHELSHLFHPYLGREGRWLSEGLASYYQNVLRARSGLLPEAEAWRRLDAGFARGRREGRGARLDALAGRDGTMRIYWSGAAYWLEMDLELRKRGRSLDTVLRQYAECCLRGTGEVAPAHFMAELDRLAGGDGFSRRFERYAALPAFPSLDAAYAALGLQVGGERLRFSDRADAVRLRRAIMGRR